MGFVFFLEVRSEKNCLVYKNCGGDISSLFGNSNIVLSHYDVAMTSELNNIQLSPEGEVNSGGYIPRREASMYPPLFTDPEGDSCFSIYQIRWIK